MPGDKPARPKRHRLVHTERLLNLGLDLMATADEESTSLRRFKAYRDGLMMGLLAIRPLRMRNLAGLILDRTLVQRGDGWWIEIPAAETKTKDSIEEPWPDSLAPHLQTYLVDHRAGIAALRGSRAGTISDALWLSMYGPPMNDNAIYIRIVVRTRQGLGQAINPHLFRDCAATSIAIDDPAHVGIASRLLGAHAAWIFHACTRRGLAFELLNLGGGLPAHYRAPIPPLSAYAEAMETALAAEFGGSRPRILVEPGRYLVGDAGVLRAEILLISRKSLHERERWVYLGAGLYNGLDETLDEGIRYRIRTPREGGLCGPVILAGPTCDSADILYGRHPYDLPLDLAIGDPLDFVSAGAYTGSVAAVAFNGFPPIRSYFV